MRAVVPIIPLEGSPEEGDSFLNSFLKSNFCFSKFGNDQLNLDPFIYYFRMKC